MKTKMKNKPVVEEKNGKMKKSKDQEEEPSRFNLNKFVKKGKEVWTAAAQAAKKNSTINLDPGDYIGRVNKLQVKEYEKKGETQYLAIWGLTVIEGKEAGNSCDKLAGLNDERGREFFLRDLGRFGYDPEEVIDNLEEVCEAFAKDQPVIQFRVVPNKDNPEYVNIYFQKYIEDYEEDEKDEDEDSDEDEDEDEEDEKDEKEDDEDEENDSEDEDEEDSEDEEDEGELEIGSMVEFEHEGEDLQGKVVSINEKDEVAKVKVKSLGKSLMVPIEELTLLSEED